MKVNCESVLCANDDNILNLTHADVEKDEGKKMDTIIENMALCVYEKSNDVRDILNDGFDSKEEQERLFEKYGVETNVSREQRLSR